MEIEEFVDLTRGIPFVCEIKNIALNWNIFSFETGNENHGIFLFYSINGFIAASKCIKVYFVQFFLKRKDILIRQNLTNTLLTTVVFVEFLHFYFFENILKTDFMQFYQHDIKIISKFEKKQLKKVRYIFRTSVLFCQKKVTQRDFFFLLKIAYNFES